MFYRWENNNLHLFLRVQPKASKDEFSEILDDRIKLRITAPPVDGKANKHLLKFLSKAFKVPKTQITLKSGETGRNKHLIIQNPQRLPEQISDPLMQNNIWIIGCGDIGRRVAKLHQSNKISAVVHSAASVSICQNLGINVYPMDFDQEITLPENISSSIYYFMPPPPTGCEDTRLKHFLEKIGKHSKRIVLISTTGVYGDSKGAWIDENTPVNPKADRAHRRLSAEKLLIDWSKQTGGKYVILRVPGIYAQDRLPLTRLKKALPIVREEEAGWTNRIHADDLAQACKIAMQSACSNEIINICDGSPSTMTDYFNQIADYANLPRPPQISMREAEETLSAGMVSYLKESRRICNDKMLKRLKIKLRYPDLKSFLQS